MNRDWPFDQPPNCATLTTRPVLDRREPILFVSHDEDDHGWQFIGTSDGTASNGCVVALQEIVEIDPSVLELADMPPGWFAVREKPGGKWTRRRDTNG